MYFHHTVILSVYRNRRIGSVDIGIGTGEKYHGANDDEVFMDSLHGCVALKMV